MLLLFVVVLSRRREQARGALQELPLSGADMIGVNPVLAGELRDDLLLPCSLQNRLGLELRRVITTLPHSCKTPSWKPTASTQGPAQKLGSTAILGDDFERTNLGGVLDGFWTGSGL